MKIEYDEKLQMWQCEEEVPNRQPLRISIGEWRDTRKGKLVDFAIFIGDNDIFYEIELLNKSLSVKELSEFCSTIVSRYRDFGERFFDRDIVKIFSKCTVNAYCREGMDKSTKLLKFIEQKYYFGKYHVSYHEVDGESEKSWSKPALEYPGSRLDSICD